MATASDRISALTAVARPGTVHNSLEFRPVVDLTVTTAGRESA
ncbi:hypothetical protein [Cryptosporangium arvum]|nr:hypothetical protein [Cryptosporangium arvum]